VARKLNSAYKESAATGVFDVNAYQLGRIFGAFIGPLLLFSLAYYLWKARSLPFRSALLNPWVLGISFAIAATQLAVRGLPAEPSEPQLALSNDEMVSAYAGCVDTAKTRMTEPQAKETCACIITAIQNTFSRENYTMLNSGIVKTGVVPPEIGAIAGSCEPKGQ
jgi:hypothetical protein